MGDRIFTSNIRSTGAESAEWSAALRPGPLTNQSKNLIETNLTVSSIRNFTVVFLLSNWLLLFLGSYCTLERFSHNSKPQYHSSIVNVVESYTDNETARVEQAITGRSNVGRR